MPGTAKTGKENKNGHRTKNYIDNAEKAGACKDALEELKKCKTLAEALAHKDAPYWAYWYASDVVKGRWDLGEAAISRNAEWSYLYARDVVRGRFEQGEAGGLR